MKDIFRVGITRDMLDADGTLGGRDIGLDLLDGHPDLEWEFMPEDAAELSADQIRSYDAVIDGGRRVTSATLKGVDRLALVARFGAGFDVVDVGACTRAGVILTTAPDGVRRPVASSFMAFILALSHKVLQKDRLPREGRWDERQIDISIGLVGRVLGLIGMGSIGGEVFRLAAPFEMRHITYDPFVTSEQAAEVGAELVDLETLLRTSDFVCVSCPLNDETYHLINEERLLMMKKSAFLINVARGSIVDQKALTNVLQKRLIQGAALDVFENEPVDSDDPILALDNVIVSPHNLAMTDQCWRSIGEGTVRSILEVAAGNLPSYLVINKEVINDPRILEKLRSYASAK